MFIFYLYFFGFNYKFNIFSALITNSTDKFNNNTPKYLLVNGFFTGNITHTPRFGETMNLNASFFHSRLSIARSRPIMVFADTDPQLSLSHFGKTINLNYPSAFSCSSFSPCSLVLPDYHLHLSHQIVFFVGAAPPLSLDLSAYRKQPLAVEFHPFSHFSVTFIAAIAHVQPELRFFQTHSQLFLIPPGLLLANKWPPMFLTRPPPNLVQSLHSTAPNHLGSRSQSWPVIGSQPHIRFAKYQVGGQ